MTKSEFEKGYEQGFQDGVKKTLSKQMETLGRLFQNFSGKEDDGEVEE